MCEIFLYSGGINIFYMVKCVLMKKLLTLVVLVVGVALFAGCLNKPATTEEVTTDTTTTEVTVPTTEEVVPTTDATTTDATADTTTATTDATATATAE